MADVLIIGAGPGGCFAAIEAARRGRRVLLLERREKPLKKLLVSGNGRGNLLNTGAPRYYGDAAFAEAVLARVPAARLWALWTELGVPLRQEDEGRVYPAALQAAVAAEALRLELERLELPPLLWTTKFRARKVWGGPTVRLYTVAFSRPAAVPRTAA